jgi:hypothetical protein
LVLDTHLGLLLQLCQGAFEDHACEGRLFLLQL